MIVTFLYVVFWLKSLNEIGRLRMVKEVFEYPHSSIELNSSRKELGLLQGVS